MNKTKLKIKICDLKYENAILDHKINKLKVELGILKMKFENEEFKNSLLEQELEATKTDDLNQTIEISKVVYDKLSEFHEYIELGKAVEKFFNYECDRTTMGLVNGLTGNIIADNKHKLLSWYKEQKEGK